MSAQISWSSLKLEQVVGARAKMPLARAATVTAGGSFYKAVRSFDFPYLTTEISKGAGRFPSSCFSAGADIGATLGMTAVEVFLASLSLFLRALRKKGSPGRTATADYMAGQAVQSLGNNFNVDIDFGEEPQQAVAAKGQTLSQLQMFRWNPFTCRPCTPGPVALSSSELFRV